MYCVNCGSKLEEKDNFCGNCGKIKESSVQVEETFIKQKIDLNQNQPKTLNYEENKEETYQEENPIKFKETENIYKKLGKILNWGTAIFLLAFLFIRTQNPTESFSRDIFGLPLNNPSEWVGMIPYLGFLIETVYQLFSLHGLVGMVIFVALLKGAFKLEELSKNLSKQNDVIEEKVMKKKVKKNGYRIMFFENDVFLGELYEIKFLNDGFDFKYFPRPNENVIEEIEIYKPDLIITDILMGEMNGYELIKKIRQKEEFGNIFIAVFSNIDDSKSVSEALTLGANEFWGCSKYTPDEIVEKARKLLGIEITA